MKIALLSDYSIDEYYNYGRELYWSTPKGIYDAFLADKRVSDIKWLPLPIEDHLFGFRELKKMYDTGEFIPDIIYYMSGGFFEDEYFSKEHFFKSKLILDCGDEPQTMRFNIKRAHFADLILTPDYDCFNHYKTKGYDCIFTAHWTDLNIFYPSLTDYCPFDVVTSMYGHRGDIVSFLQDKLKKSFYLKNGLIDIENGDLYRNGKIVFQVARYGEVTRRIFEGMSCKKLVITNKLPDNKKLGHIFKENDEIVFYSSKEEALEKIMYYLNNDDERNRIAENGCNKVIKYYTTKNIVNYILTGRDDKL